LDFERWRCLTGAGATFPHSKNFGTHLDPIDMEQFRGLPLVVLYVGYVLIVTLYPFAFDGSFSERLGEFFAGFPRDIKEIADKDFVYNVFFFVPLGVLLYCSLKSPERSRTVTILIALVAGGALSLVIELCQAFFGRHPSASDVFANTLGSVCGALLCSSCPIRIGRAFSGFWAKVESSRSFLFIVLLFGALPLILSAIESPWPNFRTWNSGFSFQIANEATLNRPWLGRIYLVALYNRNLSATEVAEHFQFGFSNEATKRRSTEGLVALYTFSEGEGDRVRDSSPFGTRLNLIITPRSHVRWLKSSNGIEIVQPAIIKSEGPAKKLAQAFRGHDEISIEAWFAPGNLTQKGPARVVSFSGDLSRHNFTLGQEGPDVTFWLRTLISGRTGSPAGLQTSNGFLTLGVYHVVVTYVQGIERVYVNGRQQPDILDVTKDVIIGFGTRNTPLAQRAYSFFFFFPVSLFCSMFLSSGGSPLHARVLISAAAGAGLLAIAEIFQAFAFDRAIDVPLMGYGVIIAATASLIGAGFLMPRVDRQMDLACLPDHE
jgi:VanZ like family/Concanavalin A-like lectin/glucanases superfamily